MQPLPEWFEKEVSRLFSKDGKPYFRVVDGRKATRMIDGKTYPKYGGIACWIVECRVEPTVALESKWNRTRYQTVNKNGIFQTVDLLGEFPRENLWTPVLFVRDRDDNPCSPSDRHLNILKRRYAEYRETENMSDEQIERDVQYAERKFEEKLIKNAREEPKQILGALGYAKATKNAEISKPILTAKD